MEGTMEKTNEMLAFLHPIIEKADPELEDFLIRCVISYKSKETYSHEQPCNMAEKIIFNNSLVLLL